jgi:adenylate cyclase
MGIATGYCTVGNFGSSERMDYTIIGTPVNLASRLETAADADEVFISHETWSYVKDNVICEPPQKLHLKGFHHQILAHKVLSLRDETEKDAHLLLLDDEDRGMTIKIDFSKISKDEVLSLISSFEIPEEVASDTE